MSVNFCTFNKFSQCNPYKQHLSISDTKVGVWLRQVSLSIFKVTSLFLTNMLSSHDIAEILL